MRKLILHTLTLSLLLWCGTAAGQSRKKRRTAGTPAIEQPAPPVAVPETPAPRTEAFPSEEEAADPRTAPAYDLSPAEIDSLVSLWRERQPLA